MIRYLTHQEISKEKWDNLILHSPQHVPYAESWFLDIVCPQWEALVEDNYMAVMPLTGKRKYGIRYLYQPFFTQQSGVFSVATLTDRTVAAFLENIPSTFKYIDINLNTHNPLAGMAFTLEKKVTHHLLLNIPHETIQQHYNENTQRNLKRAQKAGLILSDEVSVSELIALFRDHAGKNIREVKNKDYMMFRKLAEEALRRKKGVLKAVRTPEGRLSAAAFFIISGNFIVNLLPAADEEAKKNGAMTLLLDDILHQNQNSGKTFDFEGGGIASIGRFYKGFGSKEVYYFHLRKNALPALLKYFKK